MGRIIIKGIEKKTIAGDVMNMKIMAGLIVPKKKRKARAVETKPRDMAEKRLEEKILLWIQSHPQLQGGKTESSPTYNTKYTLYGATDLEVFNLATRLLWKVEIKRKGEVIKSKNQKLYRMWCEHSGTNHIEVDCLEDMYVVLEYWCCKRPMTLMECSTYEGTSFYRCVICERKR